MRSKSSLRVVETHPWRSRRSAGWHTLSAGRIDLRPLLPALVETTGADMAVAAKTYVGRLPGNFGFIAENDDYVVAATDRVRGYPIFYSLMGAEVLFSNSARDLRKAASLEIPDPVSILEGLMAGFVTGNNTLYLDLHQVLPGEVVVLDKATGKISTERYYEFGAVPTDRSDDQLLQELFAATHQIFRRVMEEASGRLILVPLSGGLDSRLVLAMLKSLGYPSLEAFSYGPLHNEEANRARVVAERLDVPWTFFPSKQSTAQRLFGNPERIRYWRQADGLCSVPNMLEYQVFSELTERNHLPSDVVVVNGQSGDFITGGHIPEALNGGHCEVFEAIVEKHYSLWKMMLTRENLALLRDRFEGNLSSARRHGSEPAPHLYEYWEWQERQSKFVVNQQRTYDFFELDWLLPLWDREYCEFWRKVPVQLKLRQLLYRRFLEQWDYRGLFTDTRLNSHMIGWPGISRAARPLARFTGVLGGGAAKEYVYQRAKYFGYYRHQLGSYPFVYFLRRASQFRNAVSLFAESWVRELFPEWMDENFPLK